MLSSLFRILGILLVLSALVVGVSYSQRESESARAQKNAALESIQQDFNRLKESALADDLRQVDVPATQPVAQGRFGEIERVMKEVVAGNVAISNNYRQTLETIGWVSILDGERLSTDVDMAKSRAMLDQARAAIDTVEKETDEHIRNIEQRIRQTNLSEKDRDDMLKGYHKGLRDNNEARTKFWTLERQTLDEVGHVIDLLSKREIWTLDDGSIAFHNESDLGTYNASLEKIDDFTRQQQQILEHQFSNVNDSLENMKR
ncbi:MAG: hypothetical protein LBB51_06940 [Zoogloeaceae bacterium]|jgi:hypothetical protein|nr:hypothetical protein [Zoogloeaceae bacterium]